MRSVQLHSRRVVLSRIMLTALKAHICQPQVTVLAVFSKLGANEDL